MNQPPHSPPPPQWRRPPGVAPGTWDYVHQRSIADHYDAFVADTPLCRVDAGILAETLPGVGADCTEVVLDLGCGTGRAAMPLAQRGYDVIAIDLSAPMLQVLRQKSAALATPGRIHPLRMNLVQLDGLAAHSADHAICLFSTLGMVQGRKHRIEVLRHAARIVRPGGTLVIHVHNRWAALRERHGTRRLIQSWLRAAWVRQYEFGDATYGYRGLKDMFMHRFSRRELLQDLRCSGWRIEQLVRLSIDGTQVASNLSIAGGFIAVAKRETPR